jgi:hypothetical protein
MFRNTVRAASLFGALMLATSAVALAGAGGNKGSSSSSISLVLQTASAAAAASSNDPSYGDSVTFAVSTGATSQPFVHLKCFQNGSLVLESWQAWFYGAAGDQSFKLGGSPAWQGGAGDCTAYLENWDSYSKNGRTTTLASTSFHVSA